MGSKKTTAAPAGQTNAELEAYWAGVATGRKFHAFTREQCQGYADSLSDIICWMEGFQAGGGRYSPQSIDPLRDLNIKLKEMHKRQTEESTIPKTTL